MDPITEEVHRLCIATLAVAVSKVQRELTLGTTPV